MNFTIICLHEGVLTFRVSGPVDTPRWRRAIAPGVYFLHERGGGSLLLPHTPDMIRS